MPYTTVSGLFTGIADAIRAHDGTADLIDHQDIPDRITALPVLDTSDADAIVADILATKTAYVNGTKLTGTLTLDTLIGDPIPQGIITSLDGSNQIATVDHYGTSVLVRQYGSGNSASYCYKYMTGITFKSTCTTINNFAFVYSGLTAVSAPDATTIAGGAFGLCAAMVTASLPKISALVGGSSNVSHVNGGVFNSCAALTTVQLGSIGYPIASIGSYAFNLCTQEGLTITVYVTPDTQPLANSPWGATNATIVYKSAVDGSDL